MDSNGVAKGAYMMLQGLDFQMYVFANSIADS